MKKIITTTISLAALIGLIVVAPVASANYSINSLSNDCKTVTIGNYTTGAGINDTCWSASPVSASPGQIINVAIYYNNSGSTAANNVVLKMTDPVNKTISQNGSISVTGQIFVDGYAVKSGTVTANILGGPSHLELSKVVRYTNGAGVNVPVSGGADIFTSRGLSLGTLNPGWNNQGLIKVSFNVVANDSTCNDCNDGDEPSVTTLAYADRSNELGEVTLRGYYNSNGSATTTWFEYRRNGGSWIKTGTQSHGISSGNITKMLSGLSTGDYEYRAAAENQHGIVYGIIVPFEIDRGNDSDPCEDDYSDDCCDYHNDCQTNDDIEVTTESAENVDEDSAKLVGDLIDVGSGDVERWFEWDTKKSEVEDGDGATLDVSGTTNSDGEFSKTLSGLDDDKTYYFRACAQDDDGDQDCGSVKSFSTDEEDNNDDDEEEDTERPNITTLNAISIGSTAATVDGYYKANGCSVATWFQYGRTQDLGSSTLSINRGNGSGSMAYSFTSLAPNMTYYYRAVGTNCEGTTYGTIKSFTTGGRTIVNPPVVITNNTGTGTGNAFIKLMIDNHRDTVRGSSEIAYDVSWENITRTKLKNLVLEVNFDAMTVVDTDRGSISRDGHSVIYEIEDLGSLESGDMTITAVVKGMLQDGDPVVAQAIMAFENPKTNAAENAIAYDSDEFNAVRTGGFLGGINFPNSLAGWLLILLIILLIIIVARYYLWADRNQTVINPMAHSQYPYPPAPAPTAPAGDDYIVYRPNPKQ